MSLAITKADGKVEEFNPHKLEHSLMRAGATPDAAVSITSDITEEIRSGMATHEIYRRAFALLREHRKEAAARYSLKRAILEFGPSGFPFESYLAELFRSEGYTASVNQYVQGKCVEHEIDVVIEKGEERIYVEAKFHNTIGFKTDLQIALYVQARLTDITQRESTEHLPHRSTGMIATNTKFTSLATAYAKCEGLELLGWEYPAQHTLHDRIEHAHLYPITALTTLSRKEKTSLLMEHIVLCRDLSRSEQALLRAGVAKSRMNDVLIEAGSLCGPRHPSSTAEKVILENKF